MVKNRGKYILCPLFLLHFFFGGGGSAKQLLAELAKKNPFEVWLGFGIFDG